MVKKGILAQVARELPASYKTLLKDLKQRIIRAQIKASLAANSELIRLYWDIGKTIVTRQKKEGWGRSVVERLSKDLRREFPDIKGFSAQNIWKMRAFYLGVSQWKTKIVESLPKQLRGKLPSVKELEEELGS